MPSKCDITRRKDLAEKIIYALLLSLLVCTGFHHPEAAKAAASLLGGPAGCTDMPAYSIGIHAAIASDDALLPKTGGSSAARASTTTTTKSSAPADAPTATPGASALAPPQPSIPALPTSSTPPKR